MMEEKVFHRPAVAGILAQDFVEARLHTDGQRNVERILELQEELTGSVATPIYVILEPATGEKQRLFEGATYDAERFAAFLRPQE